MSRRALVHGFRETASGKPHAREWRLKTRFESLISAGVERMFELREEMAESNSALMEEVAVVTTKKAKQDAKPKRQPRYNVVLWDDTEHTYDYVISMLQQLFGHPFEKAYELAKQVDIGGKAICLTTTLEHAELKRDQIHAFGKDPLATKCSGSMSASIEAER